MKEVHCITWPTTGMIHKSGCYFDRERAEKHLKACNDALSFWRRLFHHRWYIQTVKVKGKT